jgi:ElaB/YqjD/DUF883 family membrane-anchored ribosome-binding protein
MLSALVAPRAEARAMDKTINEAAGRVAEQFDTMRSELAHRRDELRQALQEYVDANPLAAVAIAFGAGYVASGALFSRATMRVAMLGGRFVLGGMLKQLIGDAVQG